MDPKECSLLPFELCEEILCRVPTKSLVRFKLTCKRWLALFNDKRFINKHLPLIQEQQIIRTNDHKVKIINPMTGACSSLSLPDEFQAKPEILAMVHCDGLLLCILESFSIAVWNPCLNQVRWIKPEGTDPIINCFFGIGYDSISRDGYKILMIVNKNGYYYSIYELNSNSWKTFKVSLDWHEVWRCTGVSLKGNMYWIAKYWNNKSEFFIHSFNFSTESFEPLCSLPFEYGASDVVALSAFRGDNLSLLHQSEKVAKIEVWVTNKVKNGVDISWTKFFNVTSPDLPAVVRVRENLASPVHFIDKNNRLVLGCEVMADENNVSVNIYIIGEGEITKQEIERHRLGFSWPYISGYAYLPSLVPVPTLETE